MLQFEVNARVLDNTSHFLTDTLILHHLQLTDN